MEGDYAGDGREHGAWSMRHGVYEIAMGEIRGNESKCAEPSGSVEIVAPDFNPV